MHADIVDQPFDDQCLPLERMVEQLALSQRNIGLCTQLPQPVTLFKRDRILQEEQIEAFHFAGKLNRFDRLQTLVHVVTQLDIPTDPAADSVEQRQGFAHVTPAVEVNAVQCAGRRACRRPAVAAATVAAALAANMGDALRPIFFDVVAQLVEIAAIGVAVDRHARAHLAAEQLIQR